MHKRTSSTILAALLLSTGCGDNPDKKTPPPKPTPSPAATTPADPAPATPAVAATPAAPAPALDPAAEAKMQKDQQDALAARIKTGEVGTTPDPVVDRMKEYLNTSYQNYFSAFNKAPGTMEDLVRAGYMKAVPPLPAGKKYKIDPNGAGITVVDGR